MINGGGVMACLVIHILEVKAGFTRVLRISGLFSLRISKVAVQQQFRYISNVNFRSKQPPTSLTIAGC